MKKQKTLNKIICLLFLLFSLGGCWDQKEIDKRAYVIALGMDKGEKDSIILTYLIANPEYGVQQQGGSTNEPPHEIISIESADFVSSANKANAVVAKEISYDLLRNFIISEKLAKEKDFIRWMYDATKEREIRRDSYFIISKEDASTYIEQNQPKLETRAQKYFDLIITRGIETASIPKADIHRYLRITEADSDLFLGIYSTTEHESKSRDSTEGDEILAGQLQTEGLTNKTQFIGSAIFKEGIMIDTLTAEETRIAILLSVATKAPEIVTTFSDPFNKRYKVTAKISQLKKIKIQMDLKKGASTINVTLPLHIDILSDHSMVKYASDINKRNELKKHLIERFEQKMRSFIKKTQEEYKGEPFGWSLVARKKFATLPEYEKFNWMKSYPDMDVKLSVDIEFGEFGRQSRIPNLDKMRD